jgi:hypothetical protein
MALARLGNLDLTTACVWCTYLPDRSAPQAERGWNGLDKPGGFGGWKPSASPQRIVLVVALVIVIETSQVEHEDEDQDEDDLHSGFAEDLPAGCQREPGATTA